MCAYVYQISSFYVEPGARGRCAQMMMPMMPLTMVTTDNS